MIRVVIADDHHLIREGIRAILEKAHDIEVIGEAVDGVEAVELAERLLPDVILMDVTMPNMNGVQALEKIRARNIPAQVLVLSMHSNEMTVRQALRAGAKGYLLKDSVSEDLLLAIRAASRGAIYLSPGISEVVLTDGWSADTRNETERGKVSLTPREAELLRWISEGLTNNEIAERMNISVKTAERHRANLMSKLGVNNLVDLIRVGIKSGLILLDE